MTKKLTKAFYSTVLSQAFSPCGNYLAAGDNYGFVSIFHVSNIVNPDINTNKEELTARNKITVQTGRQINSAITIGNYLVVGCVGEIKAFLWKELKGKSGKNIHPAWSINLPNSQDKFDFIDINALSYNSETGYLYAGCGDNKIYIFEVESRKLVKTLSKHSDYIHCLCHRGSDLISSGEDGVVNIWDIRSNKVSNKIEPHLDSKVIRPELGKWIGAVDVNDDYLLCGGGPRLALYHYRFLTSTTVFPIEDQGIHVAEIYKDKILAGGRSKYFYQMKFNGDIVSEISTSAITTYSAIHQEEPFKILSIAGSSYKIDICNNFMYKDQQLILT